MENENIKGHWMGVLTFCNGITEINFTEVVISKKIFLKPFLKTFCEVVSEEKTKSISTRSRKSIGE